MTTLWPGLSRRLLLGLAVWLAAGAALPARAEMRALLVGVSGYAVKPLQGPRNDVRRMREVLEQRSFAPANITTLADGVAGAGQPTRAAILDALDALATRSTTGDTVFLYFSGHGSQQPADRRTPEGRAEADGLHETFLPLDVGRWDGEAGTVRNALVDFELRDKVDRILATGAFVWAVFDACHSASLVREAAGDDRRQRYIDPLALGVPQALLDPAQARPASDARGARSAATVPSFAPASVGAGTAGRTAEAVYFYAARTTELTWEHQLPPGERLREYQSLFGFVLRGALASGRPMSYSQLGQVILARYGTLDLSSETPVFAGNALDRVVFGQQTLSLRQWPVSRDRLSVPVGTLSGLAEGARFLLLPDAAAEAGRGLGHAQAVRVGLDRAELEPLSWDGRPAPDLARLPAGAHARLVSSPERYSLRLMQAGSACGDGCRWRAVLEALQREGVPGTQLDWVTEGGDLALQAGDDELLGLPPDEPPRADCAPRDARCRAAPRRLVLLSSADGDDPARQLRRLGARLHAVARAHNLMRLAAQTVVSDRPGVEARVVLRPAGTGAAQEVRAEAVTSARAGDRLVVSLHNQGHRPVDVTLLYLDANRGIEVLFPNREGDVNQLEPNARHEIADITLHDEHGIHGLERLLMIAVEAGPRSERADFSFLAQSPLLASRPRSPVPDDEVDTFFDAAFPEARGRSPARPPGPRTRMQVFHIDLAPDRDPGPR